MNKPTFNRIKMLRKDGMGMKGAMTVIIDLCHSSTEAAEKIIELLELHGDAISYDRGFCDGITEADLKVDVNLSELITRRKELKNYDPKT